MSKTQKAYLIALPISLLINIYIQHHAYLNYKDLRKNGIVTKVTAEYRPERFPGPHYYSYQFSTVKGETIYRSGKIPSQKAEDGLKLFEEQYKNLEVIYNPEEPDDFWPYNDFEDYPNRRTKRIIFNLFIGTFFCALPIHIPITFIIGWLSKRNRKNED